LWITIRSARYFQRVGRTWHNFLSHYKTIPSRRDTIRKHCMTETKYSTKLHSTLLSTFTRLVCLIVLHVGIYPPPLPSQAELRAAAAQRKDCLTSRPLLQAYSRPPSYYSIYHTSSAGYSWLGGFAADHLQDRQRYRPSLCCVLDPYTHSLARVNTD
jgi:hypothetical protein